MGEIKLIINNQSSSVPLNDDQYIDNQLQQVLELVKQGKTYKAMSKCGELKEKFKNNEVALRRITNFMGKFEQLNTNSLSYRAELAGDNALHFDVLQEALYRQSLGEHNRLQLSLKCFNKDKISGTIGFVRHDGGVLDVLEYETGAELSISPGDPESSALNPLPLFKLNGYTRYSLIYTKGYLGSNRGVGIYGDGQLGVTYNGFNLGSGYEYFPYFNSYSNHIENSKGFYAELGKYFQIGAASGLVGFIRIPFSFLEQGQLPIYLSLNLNLKVSNFVRLNFQGSYLYTKEYMQGRGGAGIEVSF